MRNINAFCFKYVREVLTIFIISLAADITRWIPATVSHDRHVQCIAAGEQFSQVQVFIDCIIADAYDPNHVDDKTSKKFE